ncbi:MAG: hypothetical protein J6125_04805 [Clostridia bacterium]|nr:hypothetical protein [Clostridia bacterium]
MNFLFALLTLFFAGSVFGWLLELFYRKFFSSSNPEHKWVNPGFLTGPWVPIYGFGLVALYLLCRVDLSFVSPLWLRRVLLFALMGLSMTLIEFVAGLIFILGLHVRLWDYSNRPGNIKGIVCPLFSFFWTLLSVAFFYLVYPVADFAVGWVGAHLPFLFVVGLFYGVFLVDFCSGIHLLARLKRFANDNRLILRFQQFRLDVLRTVRGRARVRHFLFSLLSESRLAEAMRAYRERYPLSLSRRKGAADADEPPEGICETVVPADPTDAPARAGDAPKDAASESSAPSEHPAAPAAAPDPPNVKDDPSPRRPLTLGDAFARLSDEPTAPDGPRTDPPAPSDMPSDPAPAPSGSPATIPPTGDEQT